MPAAAKRGSASPFGPRSAARILCVCSNCRHLRRHDNCYYRLATFPARNTLRNPVFPASSLHSSGSSLAPRHLYQREIYNVDGVRVVLDSEGRWQCECKNLSGSGCSHIAHAQRFKLMRGRGHANPEVERTAAEVPAHAPVRASSAPVTTPARPKREFLRSSWSLVLAGGIVAGVASAVTYVATGRVEPTPPTPTHYAGVLPDARTAQAAPSPASDHPVTFVNPFDASEVFEFPPGTSEAEARDSVAEILLRRARDRLADSGEESRPQL
ncbi:MAG: hypothetical protein IRZ28_21800 [Steroidobacteraceae bacterium]|nr:hypothetical protein [Steroidobacteraceae bacterium]